MGCPQHAPSVYGPNDQLHPEGGQPKTDPCDPITWSAAVGTGDERAVLGRTIVVIVRDEDDSTIVSIRRDSDPLAGEILR